MSNPVTATFVFTDLVDSTATAARLGPERRRSCGRPISGCCGGDGGSGGTEVKNLGDGLMVMYSSPSRALSGAVRMQQAVEHHNRTARSRWRADRGQRQVRRSRKTATTSATPVVEAARLCAAAAGGQILARRWCGLMVGRHATQTFVAVGPLD